MSFFDQFKAYILKAQLSTTPMLLAVSGGLDSMVMWHLFRRAGLPFAVAHCNFQLRGTESDADAAFVAAAAAAQQVLYFEQSFDTQTYADTHGISIQMAARDLRYQWFASLLDTHGFQGIATAHHLNDAVETTLLQFVRGTGLAGLTGIHSTPALLRPLLFATRLDLETYAREQKIEWRDDSSNASDDYARNFLRHQVVPLLESLNPGFIETAARNMTRLQETKANLDFLTTQYLDIPPGFSPENPSALRLQKSKLIQLPSPKRILRALLQHFGVTEEQARQLAEHLVQPAFECVTDAGWRVVIDRTYVQVQSLEAAPDVAHQLLLEPNDLMHRLPDGSTLFTIQATSFEAFPDGKTSILVPVASLQYPLVVRRWQDGDVFQPFGMDGKHQKLQDFFTNQKLSVLEKEQVWLLVNGDGTIIWVLGMRSDERFRVHQPELPVLKCSWQPKQQ
jgi:tRNA(Ile)-lysidine synthase